KLVVTVPLGYEEPVRRALAAAGAGRVGRYTGCSFSSRGEGVFVPGEGATPFLGTVGRAERVAETRLEAVVSRSLAGRAVAAVRQAHPYEEPALDLYALDGLTGNGGLGRCGTLPEPRRLGEWAGEVAQQLGATAARLVGSPQTLVERVAVCGGSGASLWPEALAAGAQVLVTGDVKYHGALEARGAGLALLDVGHGPSERLAVDVLAEHLASWAQGTGESLQVHRLWEPDPFLAVEMRGAPGERPVEDHSDGA
ncbi:MAG: Nif3-like dinuclear metal center hexameric protein, partial [Proteobacteria bacterium]|nr:Nif3-like dinuclear metal center hexameric protein [Pseudomonadota bacterium]